MSDLPAAATPEQGATAEPSARSGGEAISRRKLMKIGGLSALILGSGAASAGATYGLMTPGLEQLGPGDRIAPRFEHGHGEILARTHFRFPHVTSDGAPHRMFALTFDDGPDPHWTPIVLDILAKYQATATFFMMGPAARRHPELVQQVLAQGHEVAIHGWKHVDVYHYDYRELREKTRNVAAALMAAGAGAPRWWRTPYGRIDAPALALAAEENLRLLLWSHHMPNGNWGRETDRLIEQIEPGAVVLDHDGRTLPCDELMEATDQLLAGAKRRSLQSVTASTLHELTAGPAASLVPGV